MQNGLFCSRNEAYLSKKYFEKGMSEDRIKWLWEERGSLANQCPVLNMFHQMEEMLHQEHWFHNGDGWLSESNRIRRTFTINV